MVVLSTVGAHIALNAPFHPDLSAHAARLSGRWRGKSIGWLFEAARENELRALCTELWGVDGSPEAAANTVTLQIETSEGWSTDMCWVGGVSIWLCGRQIAVSMPERGITRPGKGVKFLRGLPRARFGTLDAVQTYLENGTIFALRDVPGMAVSRFEAAVAGHGVLSVI